VVRVRNTITIRVRVRIWVRVWFRCLVCIHCNTNYFLHAKLVYVKKITGP